MNRRKIVRLDVDVLRTIVGGGVGEPQCPDLPGPGPGIAISAGNISDDVAFMRDVAMRGLKRLFPDNEGHLPLVPKQCL